MGSRSVCKGSGGSQGRAVILGTWKIRVARIASASRTNSDRSLADVTPRDESFRRFVLFLAFASKRPRQASAEFRQPRPPLVTTNDVEGSQENRRRKRPRLLFDNDLLADLPDARPALEEVWVEFEWNARHWRVAWRSAGRDFDQHSLRLFAALL